MTRAWVQMGHCFRRSGSIGTAGEQEYVSRVAKDAAAILRGVGGHTVKLALADERITGRWDLFVALHCDGSVSPSASGASVGYRTTAGRNIARLWKRRFEARGWPYGFRPDNYTGALRYYYGTGWAARAGIPRAFILEHGFLTNPNRDRAWLTSARGRRAAALALADTIVAVGGDGPVNGGREDEDMLRRGDTGPEVGELQDALNYFTRRRDGFDPDWYPLASDEDYGSRTAQAVADVKRLVYYRGNGDTASAGFQARMEAIGRNDFRHDAQHDRLVALEGHTHGPDGGVLQPPPTTA